MQKLNYTLFLTIFFIQFSLAQTKISGQLKNEKGETIAFANIYLKDIYDGSTSNKEGQFSFTTEAKGEQTLVVSFTGYENQEKVINIEGETVEVYFELKESSDVLNSVVISAGAFEASDEKKMTVLKPIDIVSVAGASADVYGALQTLPGVSQIGNETGIFVRGGEATETKTIINGTIISNPFFGQVPDLPARGRFSPFLFKGTLFTTGGYSAEYGQALSSVLILNTQDLPRQNRTSVGVNMAGISTSRTQLLDKNTVLIAELSYNNLSFLTNVVPQNTDWLVAPQGWQGSLAFRHKTSNGGMFKTYAQYQIGSIGIRTADLNNTGERGAFENQNESIYINNSYRGLIGGSWLLYGGVSYSRDTDNIKVGGDIIRPQESFWQNKITLGRDITNSIFLNFGGELHFLDGTYQFNQFEQNIDETYTAFFTEAEISISKKLAARLGTRAEYSEILGSYNIAPRTSFAYKTGEYSQIAFAYGDFYQRPENEFLRQFNNVDFEKATHYILNYQWLTDDYTFRTELYYKDYQNLIKNEITEPENITYNNNGFGEAVGIDFFWRDKKSIKNLDYWVSYSYIESARNFRDYPQAAQPDFITNHTLSVVARYQFTYPVIRVGATYTYASGRTYRNPNNNEFLSDLTPDYHNLSFSFSYLTTLFNQFTVMYCSLNNPFGFKQVFGYRYSEDGQQRQEVLPAATTSFFVGMFISISN